MRKKYIPRHDVVTFHERTTFKGTKKYLGTQALGENGLINVEDAFLMYSSLDRQQTDDLWKFKDKIAAVMKSSLFLSLVFEQKLLLNGAAIALSPTLAIAARHVITHMLDVPPDSSIFIHHDNGNDVINIPKSLCKISEDDLLEYHDASKNYNYLCANDCDPITRQKSNEFSEFNIASIPCDSTFPHIYPSSNPVKPDDSMVVLYHTSVLMLDKDNLTKNMKILSGGISHYIDVDEIKSNYTSLCRYAAIGKALRPMIENGNILEEDTSFNVFNGIIPHSCSVLNGASSSLMISENDTPGTFSAIHIGGRIIACKKCMSMMERHANLNGNMMKGVCEDCMNGSKENFMAYNYAISVRHPAFVQFYLDKIVPSFGDEILPLVKEYLDSVQE